MVFHNDGGRGFLHDNDLLFLYRILAFLDLNSTVIVPIMMVAVVIMMAIVISAMMIIIVISCMTIMIVAGTHQPKADN